MMNNYDRNYKNSYVYGLLKDLCDYSIENNGEAYGDLFAWLFDKTPDNANLINQYLRPYYYDTDSAMDALDELSENDPFSEFNDARYCLRLYGDRLYNVLDLEELIIRPVKVDEVMEIVKRQLR